MTQGARHNRGATHTPKRLPHPQTRQRGAALATALLFLIVLTLLGFGAIRESRTGLRMAANEESRVNALETSQSLVDFLLTDIDAHFPITTNADLQIGCHSDVAAAPFTCDDAREAITPPATPNDALNLHSYAEVFRESAGDNALFSAASIGTTATTARVQYARFRITGGVDRSALGQGVAEIQQGVQIPVPSVDGITHF